MHLLAQFSALDIAGALVGPPVAFLCWRILRNVASHDETTITDMAAAGIPTMLFTFISVIGWARILGARL